MMATESTNVDAISSLPEFTWHPSKEAIFAHFTATYDTNLIVRARAGTGKTSAIVEAVKRLLTADPSRKIIIAAFGKIIAEELVTKFTGYNVTVKTLHALGLQTVKRWWPSVRVNFSNERAKDLAEQVCGARVPNDIKKLVAELCTKGREIKAHASKIGDLTALAIKFDCEPPAEWAQDFPLDFIEAKALEAMDLAANVEPVKTGIDGSDMIFLPVRNGWLREIADDIVVDEAQDMNPTQLEIAMKIAKRAIVVGDDKQGIFGFRGADSDALDRLKRELRAVELPLKTTFRCAKSIVREAQRFVPDFEAGDENPEGEVLQLDKAQLTGSAAAGDFILSRTNAPLVSVAMSLLRSGKRTRIAGKDIGKGLIGLVRKMRARSVPDMLTKISAWETKETQRLDATWKGRGDKNENSAYMAKLDAIRDQAEMLAKLTDGSKNILEVETRIEALFTDDGLGAKGMITCSSVHRAKGLEANRVFILQSTLRSDNDEECCICYVAITRAKSTLVYVV
jgi:superfamily I DNA/RNA helicase